MQPAGHNRIYTTLTDTTFMQRLRPCDTWYQTSDRSGHLCAGQS